MIKSIVRKNSTMTNVTIKQLRAFLALARHQSFTRAATELNVSQSALTLQIRALESALGARLFDRSTRMVELTLHGREFCPMVERLMDQLSRAVTAMQTLSTDAHGSVAVAAGSSVISLIIAPAVVRLASSYPSISVRIIEHAGRGLASRVMKGEADFGIAAVTGPTDALEKELLVKDRFGVLCARDHPLAGKSRNVIWSDLTRYPFVTLASGTDTREMLARNPGVAPHLPRPTYEVASLSALFALVERGAGFTLLPGIAALPALRQNLLFRPVYKPTMFRELYFVCEKKGKLTPAAAHLACAILDEIMILKKRTKLSEFVELARGLQVLQHELHR